jgi:hypothetical protein
VVLIWHLLLLVACIAAPAGAQERPGTLSLGAQAQYGGIFGPSDFAEDFNRGWGFAIRIRYALGGPQAIGISFENQTFNADASAIEPGNPSVPEKLKLANVTVDYLRYFNRGQGNSQYIVAGLGLYHPSEVRSTGLSSASDGLILAFGGGAEFFALRTTSIDLSLRANALFGGDAVSATIEAAVGFHHYLIK